MVEIPVPTTREMLIFLAGILIGLPAPYWYAQERIRGFSRAALSQLPYMPPPGKKEDEAMEEAVEGEEIGEDSDS